MAQRRETAEVPVHAHVWCTDGWAGVSEAVIVNPQDETVTAFVVSEQRGPETRWLVPTNLIESATESEIHLRCTLAQLHALDTFEETEEFRPTYEERTEVLPSAAGMIAEPQRFSTQPQFIHHERIPDGSVKIDRHAEVDASDGHVGHVEGFLIDERDRVSHVVVRSGDLRRQEFTIPASAILGIDDERVRLDLDQAAVHALPHVPYHDLPDLPASSR
jgi:hypothetical protein